MNLALLLALGCGPGEPCDEYRDNNVVWPACISRWAASAETVTEAERRCSQAPEEDAECREGWAEGAWTKPNPPTRDQLLSFCRSDECAFRAIDAKPPDNVVDTIQLCETRVGSLGADWATHAYARWAVKAPNEAEIARVRAVPSVYAARLDAALGHMLYCQEPSGMCPADYGPACAAAQGEAAAAPGFCDEWRTRSVSTQSLTQPATLSRPNMPPLGPADGGGAGPPGTDAAPTAVPDPHHSGPAETGAPGGAAGGATMAPATSQSGGQPLPPLPGTPTGPAVVSPR